MAWIGFLIMIAIIGVLVLGYYLLRRSTSVVKDNRYDALFAELRNIKQLKIDIVPAGIVYRHAFGAAFIFTGYYVALCLLTSLLDIITHSTAELTFDATRYGVMAAWVLVPGGIYFIAISIMARYYAMFRYGLAPHLQYGKEIIAILRRKVFSIWKLQFYFCMGLYVVFRIFQGWGFYTTWIFTFLYMFVLAFYLSAESERLVIPNILGAFQNVLEQQKNNT